jgi:gamma-glutamyltranspeptidase
MDDFSTPNQANSYGYAPSQSNYIKPGKRPMSSMSPIIIVDKRTNEVRLVLGASGGSKIISSVAQVSFNSIIFIYFLLKQLEKLPLRSQLKTFGWVHT